MKNKNNMHSVTGLGLFVPHQNIQDHDKTMKFKIKVNEGTVFILKLPLNNSSRSSNSIHSRRATGKPGEQRAAGIREYLVKNHGIEADRLLVCLPEYDARERATPRVELFVP